MSDHAYREGSKDIGTLVAWTKYSSETGHAGQVLRQIRKTGSIDRSTLLKNSHLTSRELDQVIRTLLDRDDIDKILENGRTIYLCIGANEPVSPRRRNGPEVR